MRTPLCDQLTIFAAAIVYVVVLFAATKRGDLAHNCFGDESCRERSVLAQSAYQSLFTEFLANVVKGFDHTICYIREGCRLNRGFISDGADNVVVIFDLKSHVVLQKVKAGTNPDGILFDPATKRVFAFNGRSQNVTAIDAASGDVVGTTDLEGKPEFPVSDSKGKIFANIEDKNEIVQINPKTLKVENRWSLAPCEEPSGLAIDTSAGRLFSVCSNQMMMVVNAESGKIVTSVPIGSGPDATRYDSEKKLIFSPNGRDGTMTVIKQDSPDNYSVVETVSTDKSARTMALDTKTHNIYLSAAQFGPPPEATADNPHPRPKIVTGSFHVVVVSPN